MKKAVIIGASSGIGRQLAVLLADAGYQIAVTGRRENLLFELQQLYPDKIITSCFDVQNTAVAVQQLTNLAGQLGGIDILVISAGYGEVNADLDYAIEKDTLNTNVAGFTAVADWAYNYFKRQGSGHIVNISSIAGLRGSGDAPAYSATKAYQINYMEALQQKTNKAKYNIRLTDVRPGFVDTAMAKAEKKFWVASPEKAAADILSAINKQKKVVYVTKRWWIIAILLKLLPRLWYTNL